MPFPLHRSVVALPLLLILGCQSPAGVSVERDPAGGRLYDPAIVGEWRGDLLDTPVTWRIERDGRYGYRLTTDQTRTSLPVDLLESGGKRYLVPRGVDHVAAAASTLLVRLDTPVLDRLTIAMADLTQWLDADDPPDDPGLRARLAAEGSPGDGDKFITVGELRRE